MEFSRARIITLAFLTEGSVIVVALILKALFDVKLSLLTHNIFRDICIGTIGAIPPLICAIVALSRKTDTFLIFRSLRRTVIHLVNVLFAHARIPDILFISLLAGCAEEILFRGVIQPELGIIFASILFGLIHFITPAYMLMATLMGFYIGFFFEQFSSILIPIQIHFLYDLGLLMYIKYFMMGETGREEKFLNPSEKEEKKP